MYEKSHIRRPSIDAWPWRSVKVIGIATIRQVIISHQWSVVTTSLCSIVSDKKYITTFTVYVTACDLENSSSFNKTVEIKATCAIPVMYKHIRANTHYVSQDMGVRKVSNSKSDPQCHSRSLILVPFDRPHMISYSPILVIHCNSESRLYCSNFSRCCQ